VTQQISHVTQVDNVIAIQQNQVRWTGPAKEFSANPSLYSSLCGTTTRSRPLGEESIDGDISVDEHVKNPFLCIQKPHNDEMNPGSELLEEEERTKGGVQFRHFKFYTKCAGGVSEAFALLFGAISSIIAKIISSYWFVWWIGDVLRLEKTQYIGGYLGITISQTIIQGAAKHFNIQEPANKFSQLGLA
jgi:hypothetical protein